MTAELEGLKFRGEGDQAMGERMMEVAMALIRKVDDRLERMEDKLDDISKERRDEAREHGGLEVRISTLESSHKATRGLVYAILASVAVGFLAWLFRLALAHPEVLPK